MPDRDIKEIFTENLKLYLKDKNMTFADLADLLHISKSTVSMWITGKSMPRMELLDRIADVLKIEVVDLYFDHTKQDEHLKRMRKAMGLPDKESESTTLAAHFDGTEYTEEELEEIRQFAEFVKSKRRDKKEPEE